MRRTAILLYGLASYLLGVAALLYLIAFLFNLVVPKTIDTGESASHVAALLTDLGLIALFGLQHSVMARGRFKAWLTRVVPPAAERSTYMLATALVTFTLCLSWQPLPEVLWPAEPPLLRQALLAVGLGGWGLVLVSSFLINHFDLFGLRQVWLHFTGRDYSPLPFKAAGLYRYLRHPIMTGVFIGIWVTPSMTTGHLIFALGMSVYILIGVYHEERDLIGEFGEKYRRYIRVTGRFLPAWNARASRADGAVPERIANVVSAARAGSGLGLSDSDLDKAARTPARRPDTYTR
jgi:protein-S-isoprenylcysteine O-methyltransferase Ste14